MKRSEAETRQKAKAKNKYINPLTSFGFKRLFGEETGMDLRNCLVCAKEEGRLSAGGKTILGI